MLPIQKLGSAADLRLRDVYGVSDFKVSRRFRSNNNCEVYAMDSFGQFIYASEIVSQCKFALGGLGQLNFALKSIQESSDAQPERSQFFCNEVFRSIHSFLSHASNISRLFWPAVPERLNEESEEAYEARISSQPSVARARALRAAFGLPDDHVLKSRKLHDLLEHFDEKLDQWRATNAHQNIINDYIGPKDDIIGAAETYMMRWFDPSKGTFTFRGETFDLQALSTAADEMLQRATKVEEQLREKLKNEALAL
ncbi:MAG: hypothetical protein AB1578_22425, partial [Thermodesulfobacteriota bacterium]